MQNKSKNIGCLKQMLVSIKSSYVVLDHQNREMSSYNCLKVVFIMALIRLFECFCETVGLHKQTIGPRNNMEFIQIIQIEWLQHLLCVSFSSHLFTRQTFKTIESGGDAL